MLTLRRWSVAIIAAMLLVLGVSGLTSQPAFAGGCVQLPDGGWDCSGGTGTPGTPGESGSGAGPVDFTPGPSSCWHLKIGIGDEPDVEEEVPCSTGKDWWSNTDQCYWALEDPQLPVPAGRDSSVGAWYSCTTIPCTDDRWCPPGGFIRWLDTPPPGIAWYTPAQAAAALARTLSLRPISIGMAPEEKVHSDDPAGTAPYRRTWVGIPVWLWVNNPSNEQWGSQSKSGTLGGVTISLTAHVTQLNWDSGDGQLIVCSEGTVFDPAAWANRAAEDSPTCGWRYQHNGQYTVTATTYWMVEWTGGGESGQIAMPSTSTSATVRVGELQSVNTDPNG